MPLLTTKIKEYEEINENLKELMSFIPDEYVSISKTHEHLDVECNELKYIYRGLEVKINNFLNTDDETIMKIKQIILDKVMILNDLLYNSSGWGFSWNASS